MKLDAETREKHSNPYTLSPIVRIGGSDRAKQKKFLGSV
jgi:hypothetical protein